MCCFWDQEGIKGLKQSWHPGGNHWSKECTFLLGAISGVARRWRKAENFILLALCLGNLAPHSCCCLRYTAKLWHFSSELRQWHSNALYRTHHCGRHCQTHSPRLLTQGPIHKWLAVIIFTRYHLHLVYIRIQEHGRGWINCLWLSITSDFTYSTLWCNVSTHCNNDCRSHRRNVTQHLWVIQCIYRTWIWGYPFIGFLYMIKFPRQKDLTCGMEHLLQKQGSPSKT